MCARGESKATEAASGLYTGTNNTKDLDKLEINTSIIVIEEFVREKMIVDSTISVCGYVQLQHHILHVDQRSIKLIVTHSFTNSKVENIA